MILFLCFYLHKTYFAVLFHLWIIISYIVRNLIQCVIKLKSHLINNIPHHAPNPMICILQHVPCSLFIRFILKRNPKIVCESIQFRYDGFYLNRPMDWQAKENTKPVQFLHSLEMPVYLLNNMLTKNVII